MRITSDGWLTSGGGATVVRVPTVRTTTPASAGMQAVVWHATGGVGGARFAEMLARRIQTYRRGVDRPASWHVLLPRVGRTLFQSASFAVGAWHVGKPGVIDGVAHPHVNRVTIGVELENAGPLVKMGDAYYAHPFWRDGDKRAPDPRCRVSAERVTTYAGRPHDDFTSDQVALARALVEALALHFGWTHPRFLHSHADFSAPAKTDPGSLWMRRYLPRVLSDVFTGEGPTVVTEAPDYAPDRREGALMTAVYLLRSRDRASVVAGVTRRS